MARLVLLTVTKILFKGGLVEISTKRTKEGKYLLSMGYVTFELAEKSLNELTEIISMRVNKSSEIDNKNLQKKIIAYKNLANKLVSSNNRVVQDFAVTLETEQLVTLARLADGNSMYNKIIHNLPKQNASQFEIDFNGLEGISEHQAVLNMEVAIPVIREVANKAKKRQES